MSTKKKGSAKKKSAPTSKEKKGTKVDEKDLDRVTGGSGAPPPTRGRRAAC
jgi:hypothetical protein